MDNLTPARRSINMSRIRSRNTSPEIIVRRLVHAMGYRFRLCSKLLPGKPDLVFPSRRKVIFVHGCFWHSHARCKIAHLPKSNVDYWMPKLRRTKQRDAEHVRRLKKLGWQVLVLWECQLRNVSSLQQRLKRFLGD